MDAPLRRQPDCAACGHERHSYFPCDYCDCATSPEVGVYKTAWCDVIVPDDLTGDTIT